MAYNRSIEEVRQLIGADALIYQEVEAMKQAVRSAAQPGLPALNGFDASCFDGTYITGDVTVQDILRLNEQRVQTPDDSADTSRLALPNAS